MLRLITFICLVFAPQLVAADTSTSQDNSKVIKEPAPNWVRDIPIDLEVKTPEENTSGGVYYLCSDAQVHIEKAEEYGHFAYRFLNTSGLENKSQLSFNFDPEYQTMRLHKLIIHRDGKKLDRLEETEIRVIEQESGHERQLYDGSKTALVILKDIRVGDVLEYAYTFSGRNPVFGKHFCAFQSLGFGVTVAKIYKRFLWNPESRKLRHQLLNTDTKVSIQKDGDLRELVWQMEHTPAKKRDDDTPSWFLTTPTLQLTDYASWDEFGEWARPLYKIGTELPEALEKECDRIQKLPSDSKRVMAALQFVQTKIRYLGSFMGTHSHEPYPVETIFERRFGDCKDKSIILCTMLQHLGYDAVPALVETDDRKSIRQYLPGHFNFDHVIVHLKLDKQIYWLDGTRTLQCGQLEDVYIPDYGYAFVIDGNSNDLTTIKPRGFDVKKTSIYERFDVPDLSGNMTLKVTTTATGSDADYLRDYFSTTSIKEVTEDYQKFYSEAYPEITADPVTFTDDQERNTFVVHERYEITNFWQENDSDSDQMEGWFEAKSIYQKIDKPASPIRTMPYAIYHPVNIYQTMSINIAEDWDFSAVNREIDNDAFQFTSRSSITPRTLDIHYHYQSKQDHAPIASLKQYIDDCEHAENDTFYQLYFSKSLTEENTMDLEKPGALSIILILSITCAAGLGTLIAVFAYHYDPEPKPTVEPKYLYGLEGWLVLLGIIICLTPLFILGTFYDTKDFFQGEFLMDKVNDGFGVSVIVTFVDLSTYTFLIPLSILMIVLFFLKRSSFPLLMIIILVTSLVLDAFTYMLVNYAEDLKPSDVDDYGVTIIYDSLLVIIFIPYLLLSKRVRNTFRQRRNIQPSPTPPPPLPPSLPYETPLTPQPVAPDLGSPPTLSPPSGFSS